jgi:pyruvate-formate lyase-activating enzyme
MLPDRTLVVHPTRDCNLRCRHCYAASGPGAGGQLDIALLTTLVEEAAAEGYAELHVSGGEPLLYRHLRELLERARACGMKTTVATNGTLLDVQGIARLSGVTDLVLLSIDGVPEAHDVLRGSLSAFARLREAMVALRDAGIRFGFAFTLTRSNARDLDWVAELAAREGASVVRVQPLRALGRAASGIAVPRACDLESVWSYAPRVQAIAGDAVEVEYDLVDRCALAAAAAAPSELAPTAELLPVLVVESDGTLVPFHWGFARRFTLGRMGEASLREQIRRWRHRRLLGFRAVLRRAHDDALEREPSAVFDWIDALVRAAAVACELIVLTDDIERPVAV